MKNAKFQVPTTREILSPRYSPGRARLPKAPALVWNLKFAAGLMLGAWCLGPAFAPVARAQSYSLDWHKIAGGGGTSTGGVYAVSGTIGQHDAGGPMAGGNYSRTGGFWAFYAVQTPGAPTLFISHAGHSVTVYWQNAPGWSLLQNDNLAAPADWSPSGGVATLNGTNFLTVTPPTGNQFFRLYKP